MHDYHWIDYEHLSLFERFDGPQWIRGGAEWHAGINELMQGNLQSSTTWVNQIASSGRTPAASKCPRVFVSHRQTDKLPAERIAYLADQNGFDYWLDVIDLSADKTKQVLRVEAQLGRPLTSFELSVLTAAVIEMAIQNCTHVIAVMTSNTAGSQWVPYEYGRFGDKPTRRDDATCWWDSTSLPMTSLPEYLHLAEIHPNELSIGAWLHRESKQFPNCIRKGSRNWQPIPATLPTG